MSVSIDKPVELWLSIVDMEMQIESDNRVIEFFSENKSEKNNEFVKKIRSSKDKVETTLTNAKKELDTLISRSDLQQLLIKEEYIIVNEKGDWQYTDKVYIDFEMITTNLYQQ